MIAGWSSLVARRAHNPKVVGSNPAPATNATSQQSLKGFWDFLFLSVSSALINSVVIHCPSYQFFGDFLIWWGLGFNFLLVAHFGDSQYLANRPNR